MFQDLEISRVLNESFQANAKAEGLLDEPCSRGKACWSGIFNCLSVRCVIEPGIDNSKEVGIDFSATILTSGRWPAHPSGDISIPSTLLRLSSPRLKSGKLVRVVKLCHCMTAYDVVKQGLQVCS